MENPSLSWPGFFDPEAQALCEQLNTLDAAQWSEQERAQTQSLRLRLGQLLDALGDSRFFIFLVPDTPFLAQQVRDLLCAPLSSSSTPDCAMAPCDSREEGSCRALDPLHQRVLAGMSALRAARNGQLLALQECLRWTPAQWTDDRGNSLLHLAIEGRNVECVNRLLLAQSPRDALRPNRSGDSAISLAAQSSPEVFVRVFLALVPAVRHFTGSRPPMGRRVWFRLTENANTLDTIGRMAWEQPMGKLAARLLKLAPLELFPRLRAVRERLVLERHVAARSSGGPHLPLLSGSSSSDAATSLHFSGPERGAQRL